MLESVSVGLLLRRLLNLKEELLMIVSFNEIKHLLPMYIFNEYGQLTGNYVHGDKIVCEVTNRRVKVWLNQDAYDAKDLDRLICDYDEDVLRGLK